jgi:hypothetical protein
MKISLTQELEKLVQHQCDSDLYDNLIETEIESGAKEAYAKEFAQTSAEDVISRSIKRRKQLK